MIRLPTKKVYRAFPEFDSMSDEECVRYLRALRLQGRLPRWLPWVIACAVGVASFMASPIVVRLLNAISPKGRVTSLDKLVVFPSPGPMLFTAADVLITVTWIGLWIGVPMAVWLLIRDAQISRALIKQVALARCAACKQSLIGLPVEGEGPGVRVRCPECGKLWRLIELGIKPSDLRPDRDPDRL